MSYGVVIPNRYPDIIAPLVRSIGKYDPTSRVIIIADNHSNSYGFDMIPYMEEAFVYAKAVNLGIKALGTDNVILCNDDITLLESHTFSRLDEMGQTLPQIGILSPLIMGCVGNAIQQWHSRDIYWRMGVETFKFSYGVTPVCFPCIWIRRAVIDEIGLLNEGFTGYGKEDDDFCVRVRNAKWRTAVTSKIVVKHGDGGPEMGEGWGKTWSTSYARRFPR